MRPRTSILPTPNDGFLVPGQFHKYIKPANQKTGVSREQINKLREEAENQLKRYSIDEKYSKTLGQTQLVKIVLIFSGPRLVYHGEVQT
jgi:hypothetical protein